MSTIMMVFYLLLVLSSITFLSRQNIRRHSRQRKLNSVLVKIRQVTKKV